MGIDPFEQRKRASMQYGVMFGQRSLLWYHIPAYESIKLYRHIYKINNQDFEERVNEFNKILELEEFLYTPVRQLSLGQRMRCEIVAALIHNPKIIFLDEPMIGLDFMIKEKFRRYLNELGAKLNHTLILSEHDVNNIRQICDRLIILNKGELLYDIPTEELLKSNKQYSSIEFTLFPEFDAEPIINSLGEMIMNISIFKQKNQLIVDNNNPGKVIQELKNHDGVAEVKLLELNLEQLLSLKLQRDNS